MKVFKKIGLGIISLGLISTFHIPEAKANFTVFEYTYPSSIPVLGGRTYAIKRVTSFNSPHFGKFLMKRVGSGNTFCKKYINSPSTLVAFISCVNVQLGSNSELMNNLIISAIEDLGVY